MSKAEDFKVGDIVRRETTETEELGHMPALVGIVTWIGASREIKCTLVTGQEWTMFPELWEVVGHVEGLSEG